MMDPSETQQRYNAAADLNTKYQRSMAELYTAMTRGDVKGMEKAFKQCVQIEGEHRQAADALHVRIAERDQAGKSSKYSKANYQKKALAGRKGRGIDAMHNVKRNLSLEERIERVAQKAEAKAQAGGDDVMHEWVRLSGLRGSRIG